MNTTQAKELKELLISAENLAVVVHQNPDGDALGAALALCEYATQLGTATTVVSPSPINENLIWLPHYEQIFIFDEEDEKQQKYLQHFDTVVFVDHSSNGRCGSITEFLTIPMERRAFVDHHPSPNIEVKIAISKTDSAAASCIVYELLCELKAKITKEMATCLYAGIITDTGNFRYGNGIAQVFRIASELLLLGIDKEAITQKIYYANTEQRMRLLGITLKDKMHLLGKNAAYISLSREDLDSVGASYNDTEDFVNYPLMIKDVYVSAIFIEKKDYIKLSFRSRGEFDVNLLARNHFNGGGHKNAAGGRFYGTMQEAIALYSKNVIKK